MEDAENNEAKFAAERAPLWRERQWLLRAWWPVERWSREHPRWALAAGFVVVWALASVLFYLRFPNNLLHPNFYAEDGSVFTYFSLKWGWVRALFVTFDGYFVWGIYLVEGVGLVLNKLLFGGQLVDLPKALALASYAFLGLVAALPVVLLRRYMNLSWRLVAVLSLALVPMLGSDYAVIGTIGNLKFAYVTIAFMLLLYRVKLPRESRLIPLVDLGLLVCAYTDVTVYLMLPMVLFGDGLRPKQLWKWRTVLRRSNVALWSLLVLGAALLYQLWVVKTHGIPVLPGYLNGPVHKGELPEIVVARTYLFSVTYWYYRHLSNLVSVAMLAVIFGLMWRYGRREHRPLYGLATATVLFATSLFVAARPGVTALFHHFGDEGPDQFFYAQNAVFGLALVVLAEDLARFVRARWRPLVPLGVAVLIVLPAGQAGSWGAHVFMQREVGTIKANAQSACRRPGNTLTIPIYPAKNLHFTATRAQLCTADAINYRPDEVQLNLQPAGNHYVGLNGSAHFRQVFESPENGLRGLSVYFSTFGLSQESSYHLVMYDEKCRTVLRTAALPHTVEDNTQAQLTFAPISNSSGQRYCFTVEPMRTPATPLAVQLTGPGAYVEGQLTLNGKEDPRTVVFSLLYRNHN